LPTLHQASRRLSSSFSIFTILSRFICWGLSTLELQHGDYIFTIFTDIQAIVQSERSVACWLLVSLTVHTPSLTTTIFNSLSLSHCLPLVLLYTSSHTLTDTSLSLSSSPHLFHHRPTNSLKLPPIYYCLFRSRSHSLYLSSLTHSLFNTLPPFPPSPSAAGSFPLSHFLFP
jgi:hypothetical protein